MNIESLIRRTILTLITIIVFLSILRSSFAKEVPFTQEDRERLIRLEVTLQQFMDSVNKRFDDMREDVNKRFEDMNKRFEDMNKRFEELRDDMNKRFEQVDKRFEQMFTFLWIITGIFTTLTLGVIGFAYWDRRTIIRKAKEETIEEIKRVGSFANLLGALRELAKEDERVAKVLRKFNLL